MADVMPLSEMRKRNRCCEDQSEFLQSGSKYDGDLLKE